MGKTKEEILTLSCTERQKHILLIMREYDEGWIDEEELEKKLKSLFVLK